MNPPHPSSVPDSGPGHSLDIAITGLAARLPGAPSVAAFWRLLAEGREGIQRFSAAQLAGLDVDTAEQADEHFVPAGAPIDDADAFDASLFGIGPREAELTDPQQRLFLECALAALENAGCDPARHPGEIGVFGGAGMNGHLLRLMADPATRARSTPYELFLGNDKDFLATRVAYRLGLRGPAVAVQTACSSSLAAVHLACQSLLAGDCDMALAGGVALSRQAGYRALPGGIHAPDGHCRAFADDAAGTVPGNGVGVVVLRRLDDALAAGDSVLAVIKGSALNNDGGHKQSFTAPSGQRQTAVVTAALAAAGVAPGSIGCIEAHGTGTALGDQVEVAALARVFSPHAAPGSVALGSVKSNIGHLDAAAGIAGLIKLVLALRHRRIPPTLHASRAQPQLAQTPFHLPQALADWPAPAGGGPRRGGVSAFGIGGTNVHVVLEEAPVQPAPPTTLQGTPQLLLLSARSPAALGRSAAALADHLADHLAGDLARDQIAPPPLAAVAHTLQQGRRHHGWRHAVVAGSTAEAVAALRAPAAAPGQARHDSAVWLFSGQGTQRPAMGQGLYQGWPAYRAAIDRCASLLDAHLPRPLVALLCDPAAASADGASLGLDDTAVAQPVLFAHGWALAQCLLSLGLRPRAVAGHSLGEWVAACVAGLIDLPTALALVLARGRCMQATAPGAMLAVAANPASLAPWLQGEVVLAAHNADQACVLAGPPAAVQGLADALQAAGFAAQPLPGRHAFHSPLMDSAARAFAAAATALLAQAPPPAAQAVPMLSCVDGQWLSAQQARDASYWARQLRAPVQFQQLQHSLLALDQPLCVELGAGQTLSGLLRQHRPDAAVLALQPRPSDVAGQAPALLAAVGQLWCAGLAPDFRALPHHLQRQVPLPGTLFERQVFAAPASAAGRRTGAPEDVATPSQPAEAAAPAADASADPACSRLVWCSQPLLARSGSAQRPRTWLLLAPADAPACLALAQALAQRLEALGDNALLAQPGADLAETGFRRLQFNPAQATQWSALQALLDTRGLGLHAVVDLRALAVPGAGPALAAPIDAALAMAGALAGQRQPLQLVWCTRGACQVLGDDLADPAQAALHGLALVPGQENPALGARVIDLAAAALQGADAAGQQIRSHQALARLLADALRDDGDQPLVAWRQGQRWLPQWQALDLPPLPHAADQVLPGLRRNAHHLVIGDLQQGLGALWAQRLTAGGVQALSLVAATWPDQTQAAADAASGIPAGLPGGPAPALHRTPTDAGAVASALSQAVAAHGPLASLFVSLPTTHAGLAAPLGALEGADPTRWAANQQGRLALVQAVAAWVAAQAAAGQPVPALVCVQSSSASVLGGLGLAAYAAASQAIDAQVLASARLALADQQARAGRPGSRWLALQWDPVHLPSVASAAAAQAGLGRSLEAQAFSADAAWAATGRCVGAALRGTPGVSALSGCVVMARDLPARCATWRRSQPQQLQAAEPAAGTQPGLLPARPAHARPALATPYRAPGDATEAAVAQIWQTLLRIEPVGLDDSFFDLGGQSLLAIQTIARLRQDFNVQLELRDLLDGTPTVAGISALLRRQLAAAAAAPAATPTTSTGVASGQDLALAALLAEVQALSPDQVRAQLAQPVEPAA